MLQIALSGGIGSGKSTFAALLEKQGAYIVDYDQLARQAVEVNSPDWEKIKAKWGSEVLKNDGSLDRQKLGARVFADREELAILNAITHPEIYRLVTERIQTVADKSVLIHDIPLLHGSRIEFATHANIILQVIKEERINRLLVDRGLSKTEIETRIARQISEKELRELADVVVENTGSLAQLEIIAQQLWNNWIVPFSRALTDSTSDLHITAKESLGKNIFSAAVEFIPNFLLLKKRLEYRGIEAEVISASSALELQIKSGNMDRELFRDALEASGLVWKDGEIYAANPQCNIKFIYKTKN